MSNSNKFIIAYDTICDGWQTSKDENEQPVLYDNKDEAIREMFDDAHSMLTEQTTQDLKKLGVKTSQIKKMGEMLQSATAQEMQDFLEKNSQCNYNNEFIVPTNEYVEGRKTIFYGT